MVCSYVYICKLFFSFRYKKELLAISIVLKLPVALHQGVGEGCVEGVGVGVGEGSVAGVDAGRIKFLAL